RVATERRPGEGRREGGGEGPGVPRGRAVQDLPGLHVQPHQLRPARDALLPRQAPT
ncbi:unnamed protein product, partial [Closterium sp. NIES-54]